MTAMTTAHRPGVGTGRLEVEGLTVDLDTVRGTVRAIHDVSFRVEPGETLAVVGESGSGKSLTAQAIAGLLDPVARVAEGSIRIGDTDVLTLAEHERRKLSGSALGYVFQDALTALNPTYKVGRQLAEPMDIHHVASGAEAKKRVAALLEKVGIPSSRADAYPHELSGGMRQRVLIALAIALDPAILIADEPTTALDVTIQAQIMELLTGLQRESGMALILISHDLGVVARHATQVAVMYAGRIVEQGTVEQVLQHPQHPYTVGLIEAMPGRGARGVELRSIPGSPPQLHELPRGCAFAPRCPRAQQDCRVTVPPLAPHEGRRVACYHPGGSDEH